MKSPIIKGTFFLTLASASSRFMGFFYRIFLNRILGAAGIGLYQLVMPLFSVCYSLCCFGFQSAVSKRIAENTSRKNYILLSGVVLSFSFALILCFTINSNADQISNYILKDIRCVPLIKMLSYAILPASIHSCINGYFYGLQKTIFPAISQIIEQLGRIGSCMIIYRIVSSKGLSFLPLYSITGIVAGELFALLFLTTSVCLKNKIKFISPKLLIADCKETFYLFIPLSLNYILISFSSSIENILLPQKLVEFGYSNSNALEIFGTLTGLSLPILLFPCMVCGCASLVLLPSISKDCALKNNNAIHAKISLAIFFGLTIGLTFSLVFYIFSKQIGLMIFDSYSCGYFIKKLCWICPLLQINALLGSILQGMGKAKTILGINIFSSIFRIAVIIFLIPVFGIKAYIYGLLLSYGFSCLLLIKYSN